MIKHLLLYLFITTSLLAVDIYDNLRIHGFATQNLVLNTSDDIVGAVVDGGRTLLEKNRLNYGYSLIGAQLEWDISESIELMVQGSYANDDDINYDFELDWLIIGYDFGNDYKLRVGRLKVPLMKGLELRHIGSSRLWTMPQLAPRGVNGFDTMHGAELLKNTNIGDVDLEFQATYGKAKHGAFQDKNKNLYNIALKTSYENKWIRYSYGQLEFDHYLRDGKLEKEDAILTFASVETELHFDELIFFGGYSNGNNNQIPDARFYYASLAYELDEFTPYVLYSDFYVDRLPVGTPPAPGQSPPPGQGPPPRIGYDNIKHNSIGVRYDYNSNIDVKLEYDYLVHDRHLDSLGPQETYANIFTLSIDVVF